ncbi:MAG: thioredoxin family protein [Polyangiaceae bacterium]|nr:thioredoxin family protein [Polyangiaceae bacterium]MBK8940331.1 thioredoxin family protein [Polyangiaceae bacterium]
MSPTVTWTPRGLFVGLAAAALSLSACATSGVPSDAATTVLSFEELDCGDCGDHMARAMIGVDGVYKTKFDKRRAELTIVASPKLDVFAIAQKNKPAGEEWSLALGAGKGRYKAWAKAPEQADVLEIAVDGADVADLAAHLAKGKVTLFDFSAKWCEPCRELDAHLVEELKARPDLAYRKLDIGDWDTPLAARYMKGVGQLPYVIVFDKAGARAGDLSGLDLPALDALLDKAGSTAAGAPAEKKAP